MPSSTDRLRAVLTASPTSRLRSADTMVLAIGLAAFYWSFGAIAELAVQLGTPLHRAWVLPLVIDAFIAALASIAHDRIRASRPYWGIEALIVLYSVITVGANALHADCASGLCYALNGVPGLTLAMVVHVRLSNHRLSVLGVEPSRAVPPAPARPALTAGPDTASALTADVKTPIGGRGRASKSKSSVRALVSDDAKRKAVARLGDESAKQIADDVGVSRQTIYAWRDQYAGSANGHAPN